jgi:non-ribosomal peptide synthetase component F
MQRLNALVMRLHSFTRGNISAMANWDQLANRVAHALIGWNPSSGQRIGLCLDRSILAIAAMIGVLRTGSAFVPLDPEYPIDRLRYMVEDACVEFILCDERYQSLFALNSHAAGPTLIGPSHPALARADTTKPGRETTDETLAYIMYTSGSTGNPKGVEIQHGALATYCAADIDIYQLTPADRTLQFSTLNFDIAIEEIFPPLLIGSTVVIRRVIAPRRKTSYPRSSVVTTSPRCTVLPRTGMNGST